MSEPETLRRNTPVQFYAPETQAIVGNVVMLPQEGSSSGGTHRPLNSYAVLFDDHSLLFDAPYSWTMGGIRDLAKQGKTPRALVLSHRNTAGSGDAFEAIQSEFGIPVLLHPADQGHAEAEAAGVPFGDPMDDPLLQADGIEVIHIPGHTAGSIVLYVPEPGGVLLAGDGAVAPGPGQAAEPPRLERPKMAAEAEAVFRAAWQKLTDRLPLAAVLPLHGQAYLRDDLGDAAFERALANVWQGPPMDPSGG